jgi:hypothetical protein
MDIYIWREQDGESECLTCVVANPELARYQGTPSRAIQMSADLSHVYFESTGQLVPGQGEVGDPSIYALSEGQLRFVADPNANGGVGMLGIARLSQDGHVLLFLTEPSSPHLGRELTADRQPELCVPTRREIFPSPCQELFRYDDRDGSLECISCRHGGITENSVDSFPGNAGGSSYALSGDGSTIAFTTAESLVPEDVNHSVDVYEWRNGVVRPVSDGLSIYPGGLAEPEVVAVNGDGRDIFFTLADPGLTGFEEDSFSNLYNARIGGGFDPPSTPPHCAEESCQGPIQPAPSPPTSASAGFAGLGNVATRKASKCARGKTRRHGRCVKKRHRQGRHNHRGDR